MVKIYPSAEALKAAHECWQECGIVEVQLQPVRIVQEGEYL